MLADGSFDVSWSQLGEVHSPGDAEAFKMVGHRATVTQLGRDLQDKDYPIEARSLGRTLIRWKKEIAAWHEAHVTN